MCHEANTRIQNSHVYDDTAGKTLQAFKNAYPSLLQGFSEKQIASIFKISGKSKAEISEMHIGKVLTIFAEGTPSRTLKRILLKGCTWRDLTVRRLLSLEAQNAKPFLEDRYLNNFLHRYQRALAILQYKEEDGPFMRIKF